MTPRPSPALLLPGLALLVAWAAPAHAQWSSDPAVDLSVGAGPSDQILPKLGPTADGGTYVSWFDGIANGYDVRLQRLDAAGVAQWPPGGVLVADRGFTSVQDYGLAVHAGGDALLAFRDDRSGSVQITVQRVTAAGVLAWGPGGVQLTAATGFVANPKVAGTTDGDVVASWMEDGTARVMRLASDGSPVLGAPIDLVPPAGTYTPSDLHPSGVDVVLSIVHQTTSSFLSPKHLLAQKLGPTGSSLWGAQPRVVFDGGSLQIGNFPPFVPDGAGGAVFSWYGVSPLQCYVQRLLADGSAAFPHNGVAASSDLANVRVSPSAAFDAASSSTYLFWKEQNGLQSLSGLYGQRFDATGNPQWGAAGKQLVAVGPTQVDWVRALPTPAGAFVLWIASPGFGQDTGQGAVVDAAGDFVVAPQPFASTSSGKTRLAAALGETGQALLAWGDSRNDGGDVLAQNVRPDGSLGLGPAGTAFCFGIGCPCANDDPAAGCAHGSGSGARLDAGGQADLSADTLVLLVSGSVPGQAGVFFQGTLAAAGLPFGDGLLCGGGALIRLFYVVADASGCAASDGSCGILIGGGPLPISTHPEQTGPGAVAPGATRFYQYWYRDSHGSPCGTGFGLSNGLLVTWS